MTERHGEPTRYLTFKLDSHVQDLWATEGPAADVLHEIASAEPEGITFEELVKRASVGPQHLRAVLGYLFGRDYIITNRQIAKLKEKHGIDAQKLRRYGP